MVWSLFSEQWDVIDQREKIVSVAPLYRNFQELKMNS